MVKIILILLAVFLIGFILWVVLTNAITTSELLKEFKRCNVMVFGHIGSGKDLLTQKIINKRKQPYYANIDYGGDFNKATPKDLELTPNTYENFIKGDVTIIKKNKKYEGKDFYFSDCGIILPSQYDTKLYKEYPSFATTYALIRHLFGNHIHCNTQNLGRVWKALREQADFYVKCRGCIKLPFIIVIKVTMYDKYESADKSLLPYKIPLLFNQYQKAEAKQYKATNGYIKNGFVIISKRSIHYDTRAYHKIIFGRKFDNSKT